MAAEPENENREEAKKMNTKEEEEFEQERFNELIEQNSDDAYRRKRWRGWPLLD